MDRKFHTDDFERMLREMSDEFRMYPSKRIWNSIYNNIHPGRKWPSVVMTITLIFTLIFVGHLNTSDATVDSESIATAQVTASSNTTQTNSLGLTAQLLNESSAPSHSGNVPNNLIDKGSNKINTVRIVQYHPLRAKTGTTASELAAQQPTAEVFEKKISEKKQPQPLLVSALVAGNQPFNPAVYTSGSKLQKRIGMNEVVAATEMGEVQTASPTYTLTTRVNFLLNTISTREIAGSYPDRDRSEIFQNEILNPLKIQLVQNNQDMVSQKDREWIENYALYNRRAPKKWVGKLSRQLYATPSVVYRRLSSSSNYGNPTSNPPYATANHALNDAVNQIPAMGMEMGAGLQYSIIKGLSIKGGLQLNYTRYTTNAFENSHPFSTQITLHDFATNSNYEIYKTTPYSNKSGLDAVKLHNETFQLSLPIGADLKLAGNEKIQWNVGATIQPTFIIGGKNYLISSDMRNYVKQTDLLSKWNLNAGLETFITFKANEFTWQIGPQFRTQLFSTNSKQYVVEERLVNYGIKLGVSKIIR